MLQTTHVSLKCTADAVRSDGDANTYGVCLRAMNTYLEWDRGKKSFLWQGRSARLI